MRRVLIQVLFMALLQLAFTSAQGKTYERIISLAPSLTMNLYYLEAQESLIGCTSYCEIARPDNKQIVASAVKANIEMIVRLNPDLVIVTSITNIETIEMLKKFGIHIEVFQTPKSFKEICDQFLRLGSLLGKSTLANVIVSETKDRIAQLQKEQTWTGGQKMFIQIGANPLFTVIPNTFMDDYILLTNGTNIAADLNRGTITRESVVARNPDVIFIVTMGILGEEEKMIWEGFESLSASKHNRIFIIDSNLACTPTPLSFVKTLEIVSNLLKN